MKATGLQGDALPEIIEIIDDDTDAFGDRAQSHMINDLGGPRWVGPAAAGLLVALIGYGVATSASSSGVPTVAPAPSTIVVPTTAPRPAIPTTTAAALPPPVPYYAAEPPREFTVQSADMQAPRDQGPGSDTYQLWAAEGATATTGSWFSIDAYPGPSSVYAPNAYRRQAGALTIAIAHSASGQAITQFSPHGNSSVTIISFGWDDDALARLAASINTNDDSVDFADTWFTADHRMISSVQPWLAVQGLPIEQIQYVSSVDPSQTVAITVAQRPLPKQGGATLDRQIALRFFLDHNTPFGVDGHSAVAGGLTGESDYSLASWIDGQSIVTVGATMPLSQLIDIARTVHQVSASEWEGMKFQSRRTGNDPGSNYEQTQVYPVSFGNDSDLKPWNIQADLLTFGSLRQVGWSWGQSGGPTAADDTAQIHTVVDGGRTYVLADLPRAIAPAGQLHVLRDGLDPVVVDFNDVDPGFDRTLAAYAFSEAVHFTAQITGPDGAVLADWPSP